MNESDRLIFERINESDDLITNEKGNATIPECERESHSLVLILGFVLIVAIVIFAFVHHHFKIHCIFTLSHDMYTREYFCSVLPFVKRC